LSTSKADQLERERAESERQQMALIYDLREKLDFANSAKRRPVAASFLCPSPHERSLQNYVSYVKSSYSSVFDGCGRNDCV
jgi:hypothetical protein